MMLFIAPHQHDLHLAHNILLVFEGASGYGCNMVKCQMAPIRCTDEQISLATTLLPCQKVDFPITYLGLPLSMTKLPKYVLQPLADRIADKLAAWKGRLLHCSGHLTLIKTTLCAVPVYTLINVKLSGWLLKAVQKVLKSFLWSGAEVKQSGKCIIAWSRVQRPLHLGGLGVLDL
jgi:hypothetical protein